MSCSRLLIVSNRLPVTARVADGRLCVSDAGGGLATGLRPYHENSGGLWIDPTVLEALSGNRAERRGVCLAGDR
jgi:trehalose 6-phosphate synthase/phosphatase